MKEHRVALIARSPFPIGEVSTVRYSTYCKALAKEGVFTKVYILHPSKSEEAKLNRSTTGVHEGIHFEYLSSDTYWTASTSLIKKQLLYLFYVLKSIPLLRKDDINVIILYHHDYFNLLIYRAFCSIFNIKLLTDATEYPYGFRTYGKIRFLLSKLYFGLFDQYIVMTYELYGFYSHFLKKRRNQFFHLPMTIDVSRFQNVVKVSDGTPYIACVFGVHNRDCILDTINAYKLYSDNKSDAWILNLYGDFSGLNNAEELLSYIKTIKLEDRIIIKGKINSSDIPKILTNAECLITTAREYVSGGFPTKLGEYLASRKPVVATSAGEIPLYLEDGKSCFLAPPGGVTEIAQKLLYIHDNYDDALCIAKQGYLIAISKFNAENKIEDLLSFFSAKE